MKLLGQPLVVVFNHGTCCITLIKETKCVINLHLLKASVDLVVPILKGVTAPTDYVKMSESLNFELAVMDFECRYMKEIIPLFKRQHVSHYSVICQLIP